jgi:hypothetical protein
MISDWRISINNFRRRTDYPQYDGPQNRSAAFNTGFHLPQGFALQQENIICALKRWRYEINRDIISWQHRK